MRDRRRALEYLAACSESGAETLQISQMNHTANLRKEMSAIADHWIGAEVSAGFSRLMVESRYKQPKFRHLLFCERSRALLERVAMSNRSQYFDVSLGAPRPDSSRLVLVDAGGVFRLLCENTRFVEQCDNAEWKPLLLTRYRRTFELCQFALAS